jgi:DNA-binding transcriptional regulator YiaG
MYRYKLPLHRYRVKHKKLAMTTKSKKRQSGGDNLLAIDAEQQIKELFEKKRPWKHEIKSLRALLGLNQHQFAERLGASQQSVSDWEKGRILPSPGILIRMGNLAPFPDCLIFWQQGGIEWKALHAAFEAFSNYREAVQRRTWADEIKSHTSISIDHAANMLAMSDQAVHDLIRRGALRAHREYDPGSPDYKGEYLVEYDSIIDYLNADHETRKRQFGAMKSFERVLVASPKRTRGGSK